VKTASTTALVLIRGCPHFTDRHGNFKVARCSILCCLQITDDCYLNAVGCLPVVYSSTGKEVYGRNEFCTIELANDITISKAITSGLPVQLVSRSKATVDFVRATPRQVW